MISRLYLEITTCCNLSCSFCPGTRRPAAFLSPEQFRVLAQKLRPYGQYLYLHVMGEPLLHPHLPQLLAICRELDFRTNLTTNGTLLPKKQAQLLAAPALRKVSISLHSFEANAAGDFSAYLSGCTDFAAAAKKAGILSDFRLWNLDGAATRGLHEQNDASLPICTGFFPARGRKTPGAGGWRTGSFSATASALTGRMKARLTTAPPGAAARFPTSSRFCATGRSSRAVSTTRGRLRRS